MTPKRRAQLYERVDRLTRLPMMLLAVLMVPLLLGPELFRLSPDVEELFFQLDLFIWATFALELGAKTYLAPSRTRYLRENWVDVVIVAVPIFRPFRLLRFLRLGVFMARAGIGLRRLMVGHGMAYTLTIALVVVGLTAVLMSIVEYGAEGATIQGIPDALWWAVTTVSTVGYGDRYPVTQEGRVVAAFLMVVGIALFGIFTATLAAFFVETDKEGEFQEVLRRLEAIEGKLDKEGGS